MELARRKLNSCSVPLVQGEKKKISLRELVVSSAAAAFESRSFSQEKAFHSERRVLLRADVRHLENQQISERRSASPASAD
jgi:hypothetical protein